MVAEKLEMNLRAGLRGFDPVAIPELSDLQVSRLLEFVRLLSKWNRVYNLTAVRDPAEMVTRHLLDSLSVLPYIAGRSVIDVGAGAGLPGIPLALVLPDIQFVLLDSNSKKTRFMQQVKTELQLNNVTVVCARVEDLEVKSVNRQASETFDVVISRAFSSLLTMVKLAGHLCKPSGCILAMKGVYPQNELTDIPKPFEIKAVHELKVPQLNEDRYLIEMVFGQITREMAK